MLEIARAFLKLGCYAFGGPAAHIAMMEQEFVSKRGWLSEQHFLDLVGATNLIPGPNSTEMTMHVGYERGGWRGLFIAGSCFIAPAVVLSGLLAWLYVNYGTLPQAEPLLRGIKPAVLAIILGAVWKLGRRAVKGWRYGFLGLLVTLFALAGYSQVLVLLTAGVLGAVWIRATRQGQSSASAGLFAVLFLAQGRAATAAKLAADAASFSVTKLFWFFLKIGAILYGSGYVLVAFLEGGLVHELGWLTQEQLLDAIAIGQFTPGPVLSTSTFIGYLVGGAKGAVAATVGIFLPSFFLVLALNPMIAKLRQSLWLSAFLDSVNVAAVALMVAVTLKLGLTTLVTWPAWLILVMASVAVLRFQVNAAWLVLGGALLGWLLG